MIIMSSTGKLLLTDNISNLEDYKGSNKLTVEGNMRMTSSTDDT